jgi:hypothetical protein
MARTQARGRSVRGFVAALVVGSLLAGVVSVAAGEDAACAGVARENCEMRAASNDSSAFHIEALAPSEHIQGFAIEHFEATQG